MGTLPAERLPSVAIVGTRKPSSYGKEVTQQLAYDLAKKGIVIISGLALGVDGIAHRAALEAGGTTIAVLANGLPQIYPATHKDLADQITKQSGAVLSEYEPETSARAYQFLQRNRIVSGLSDAIIITEAAARSGTLNTAMHALEQGKEVFVVPGNITSPLSSGCNTLLKQGARPATCADDILEVIAPDLLQSQATLALGNSPLETTIIQLLASGIRDGEELQQRSDSSISEFNTALTMMEITGTIRSLGANQWTIR
jgi:DNA processing protein